MCFFSFCSIWPFEPFLLQKIPSKFPIKLWWLHVHADRESNFSNPKPQHFFCSQTMKSNFLIYPGKLLDKDIMTFSAQGVSRYICQHEWWELYRRMYMYCLMLYWKEFCHMKSNWKAQDCEHCDFSFQGEWGKLWRDTKHLNYNFLIYILINYLPESFWTMNIMTSVSFYVPRWIRKVIQRFKTFEL